MGNIGPFQLLIVLAIVVLIFGGKRLRTLGSDLGESIKGFKEATKEKEEPTAIEASSNTLNAQKSVIDAESVSNEHDNRA